jgi:hypothetical protein
VEGSNETLLAFAQGLLARARSEAADGYASHDAIKVRKAAENAWKAACAATDAAMAARGIPRDGTTADRARHYDYLESLGRPDLVQAYALFADRLHQLCALDGHVPSASSLEAHFGRIEAFTEAVNGAA